VYRFSLVIKNGSTIYNLLKQLLCVIFPFLRLAVILIDFLLNTIITLENLFKCADDKKINDCD